MKETKKNKFLNDLQVMVKGYVFSIQMAVADKSDELFADITIKTIVTIGAKLKIEQEKARVQEFISYCENGAYELRESVLDHTSSYADVFNDLVIKNLVPNKYVK